MSTRMTIWRRKNPEKYKKQVKRYLKKNRKKINNYYKKYPYICLKSWCGFIPLKTKCRICGKSIYFNKHDHIDTIAFDHRSDGLEKIKGSPSLWLRQHKRNKKNEEIWLSCNFGYLCIKCNSRLPTKDRIKYLENLTKYIKESEGDLSTTF